MRRTDENMSQQHELTFLRYEEDSRILGVSGKKQFVMGLRVEDERRSTAATTATGEALIAEVSERIDRRRR